jgi:hypothetical protein
MSSVPSPATMLLLELCTDGSTVPASDHFQVVFGMQGRIELMLKGRRHAVQPGRVLVIPPGEQRRCAMRGAAACLVLSSADAAHREALAPLAGHVRSVHPSTAHLMRYLASRRHADDAVSRAATVELLVASLAASTPLGGPRLRRSIDWEALERWIDERLDEPLAVAALAAQVHLSAPQFALRCRA